MVTNSTRTKVCVVTGTRAEFGLLRWLLDSIARSKLLDLQIIATGMHLSPEFGLTVKEIEACGFVINHKVEMLLSSDTCVGITKSIGLGLIGFADALQCLEPDLILVLGDRFEILSAVTAAMVARIPVAHLHGGESTEGLIDESIRHSITKMSHLHFVAAEPYRQRVIQLGEDPSRVFQVGGLGVDNINRLDLLSRQDLEESLGFRLQPRNLLITFHPVTLEESTSADQFEELLSALDELKDYGLIFTLPNADTDGRIVISKTIEFCSAHENRCYFTSLGQLRYLSLVQYVDVVVGNSSSGLLEVPSFKVPTINIGDRQRGRLKASSVIDCDPTKISISKALSTAFSSEFTMTLQHTVNPYGQGGACHAIVNVLEKADTQALLKKKFYDLDNK